MHAKTHPAAAIARSKRVAAAIARSQAEARAKRINPLHAMAGAPVASPAPLPAWDEQAVREDLANMHDAMGSHAMANALRAL